MSEIQAETEGRLAPRRRAEETSCLRQSQRVAPTLCPELVDQGGRAFAFLVVDQASWLFHFARCPDCLAAVGVATDPMNQNEPVVFDSLRPPAVDAWGECGVMIPHVCQGDERVAPSKLSVPSPRETGCRSS
ncbi:hypothetical protein V5E97_10565 [Singulisphaera sp. Ch08]|uniref:Uncharacterized protein n=1 Tax=Singulisphaera sp. Ch08 TaxID=3120278 RepID=A0AAU7CNG3_9BACT